jgi:uncharacterized membrane protein
VLGYNSDNKDRALLILKKMHQLGHINDQEYEIARNDLEII